ncbi:disulfide bond formation protein B [Methylobacterium sp. P31]
MNTAAALRLKTAGLWLAILSALTVGAVLVLQYGYGYAPCKLCLTERLPYYAAIPLGLAALLAPERLARIALGLAALFLLYGAAIGVYHAGAEWGFWPGPADCGGGTGANPGEVGDFLNALQKTKVVDCSVAALRVLGLSLAGWNVLVSFALASLAGTAAARP